MPNAQSPSDFFGFEPGSDYHMIPWEDIVAYFRHLETAFPAIKVEEPGKSTEGHPFITVYISAAENLRQLEKYRQISCQLDDPAGLDDKALSALCEEGKAVCMQTYSLHANEVGGTQAAPLIAWELLTGADTQFRTVLENVIFIMIPCANPDGELMYTNWYKQSLGTVWEGSRYPGLFHIYAAHDNNRDFIHEMLVESRYINDILARDWMPQVLLDHHHQCPDENRISIPPSNNPNWPELSPILIREDQLFGAQIACSLEEAGVPGVVSGDSWYNTYPFYSLAHTCDHYNTVGMLTETADVLIATPVYMHPDKLWRYQKKSVECPNPWKGGKWGLPDIVNAIRLSSLALLESVAKDKNTVLRRRAAMAKEQIARGAAADVKGYFIPAEQHDPSALRELLTIMDKQRVHYCMLGESFTADGRLYPAGTYYVPCNQPRYSLVALLFARRPFPIEENTLWPDGSVHVFDQSSTNIADPMGLCVQPGTAIPPSLLSPVPAPQTPAATMPACENESFLKANRLLEQGEHIWRDKAGNFLTAPAPDAAEIHSRRIALLSLSVNNNGHMGLARLTLENYHFPVTVITDKELRSGALRDFDTLLLAGDSEAQLKAGDTLREGWPEAYRSGLGTDGAAEVREFVKRGGRLIGWGKSCAYIHRLLSLAFEDPTEKAPRYKTYDYGPTYNSQGAVLRMTVTADPLTRGMPQQVLIKHDSGPAFKVKAYEHSWDYDTVGRYAAENVLDNGLLIGEEFLQGCSALVRARIAKGEVLLYAFDPLFRGHAQGTFKLLFNALYAE